MHLGIDLGTSNSAVVGATGGDLRVFKTADGSDVLPSAIYIDRRGHRFVGQRAYDRKLLSPENVAEGFKRLMGTSSVHPFAAAQISMSPEECSAEILRTLMSQAGTESGGTAVDGVVITIPAAFNQMQSEATMRAASLAKLDKVGLLQEPIAAAMAAMAGTKGKNGQFLVYDLGGGTFDVALVQSVAGAVNVVAHEGINMLGGRDFDSMIVNQIVRPWLLESFSLPVDFQTVQKYRKLIAIARYASEKAKIALSAAETAVVHAGDEEIGLTDEDGDEIYLSVEITRNELDRLIVDRVRESITLCRKVLKDSGYGHEDIDKVVLIGGPSKMPCVRAMVPAELGIPVDMQTDPMTAVAIGAAVFAESREWTGGAGKRKSSRGVKAVSGKVSLKFEYPSRTTRESVKLRINADPGVDLTGTSARVDTPEGWTSGLVDLKDETEVDVPLNVRGDNRLRITVYDPSGTPISEACTEIVIVRTLASAQGTPATHTLSVKVATGDARAIRNELEPLISKGTLLPAQGTKVFRFAKDLNGGQPGTVEIELFEQPDGVNDPDVCLPIGAFQLDAVRDLEEGDRIRTGEQLIVRWEVDENGILKCSVELPGLGRVLDSRSFYAPNLGARNFEGQEGEALAGAALEDAKRDLDSATEALGDNAEDELEKLRERVERQEESLGHSEDADTRRSVTEEARAIRQALARLKHAPENWGAVLSQQASGLEAVFDEHVREHTGAASSGAFDKLAETARDAIRRADMSEAERAVKGMEAILYRELWQNPAYIVRQFKARAGERHLAVDKALHDELVTKGQKALAGNDIDSLRRILFQMFENRFAVGGDTGTVLMAHLTRG